MRVLAARSDPDLGQGPLWRPGLAVLYAELGLTDLARAEVARLCADEFAELPQNALRTAALTYLADASGIVGDAEHCDLLYEQLSPFQGTVLVVAGLVACYGAADRYLGTLAAGAARWDTAERHFQVALEVNRQIGARTWLERTRCGYARMLLGRGGTGDLEKARAMAETARRHGRR
nr:hypothetical protein [Micromonospora sp. DSM 115978]